MKQKMDEIIKLYPNNKWFIEYSYEKDAGNEKVPYCFVVFGKYDIELKEKFPLYIDKNGNKINLNNNSNDFQSDSFECAIFNYESDIQDCINYIYDEIKKRNKTK